MAKKSQRLRCRHAFCEFSLPVNQRYLSPEFVTFRLVRSFFLVNLAIVDGVYSQL